MTLEQLRNLNLEKNASFRLAIRNSMQLLEMDEKTFASHFRISITTLRRWLKGESSPHLAMRTLIIEAVIKKLER